MIKEFISIEEKETTIRILNTRANAVRTKDIERKGVRVYKDGKIGISGAIGSIADEKLVNGAIQNLATNVDYPFEPVKNQKVHRDYSVKIVSDEDLLSMTEEVLARLRKDYPDFDFSEGISTNKICYRMKNTEGLDLEYRDAYLSLGLLLKENRSANLFDGMLGYLGRSFDIDRFWAFNDSLLKAYKNPVDLPEDEKLPIISLGLGELRGFLSQCLNGERYATGSSIFSGRLNERLFNEKITIKQNRNPLYNFSPFFDMEGIVREKDSYTLVEKGNLKAVFTDRRSAKAYNLPHTGAASGSYDDIPSLSGAPIHFEVDSKDLGLALGARPAILIEISSGGDFTADGSFAAPVQLAFLFDGEKIVGRLPEFTMRSHIYKMLGEDYIGTFENEHFYVGEASFIQAFNMTIVR